jgi:hypothetical protein
MTTNTLSTKVALSSPPKIFKSIRVRKLLYENGEGRLETKTREVSGHLNYVRLFYDGYDCINGDELDLKILEKAKATFISADVAINNLIVLEGQIEGYIQRTRGNLLQKVTIFINPHIDYEDVEALAGKKFTQYTVSLRLNLQTISDPLAIDKQDNYLEYFDISIDHKSIDKLAKTIQRVE